MHQLSIPKSVELKHSVNTWKNAILPCEHDGNVKKKKEKRMTRDELSQLVFANRRRSCCYAMLVSID